MENFQHHDGFFAEDAHMLTYPLEDDASGGWLISSPSTTIVSKMHLSSPRNDEKSLFYGDITPRRTQRKAVACQASSKELQYRLSLSDSADPGLIDDLGDPFGGLSGSEVSLDELKGSQSHCHSHCQCQCQFSCLANCHSHCHSHCQAQSQAQSQPSPTELWDSYWSPPSQHHFPQLPQHPLCQDVHARSRLHTQGSDITPCKRNFGSSHLSDLDVSNSPRNLSNLYVFKSRSPSDLTVSKTPTHLHRTPATRSPKRTPTPHPHPHRPAPQPLYSPFPPAQLPLHSIPSTHAPHKSWPLHPPPIRAPLRLRARALTTPSDFKTNRPSNLSSCTTVNYQPSQFSSSTTSSSSSSSDTPLYMRPAPAWPYGTPQLMDLMEKSCFESDSDDEVGGVDASWLEGARFRWHSRGSSNGSAKAKEVEMEREKEKAKSKEILIKEGTGNGNGQGQRRKKMSLGKCTSEALKEIFGKKKLSGGGG